MQTQQSSDNPLIAAADSVSFRVAHLNERGAKVQMAAPDREHLRQLKEFKRIALRADKTDASFSAIVHLRAALINSR
jgi:hypothetical protein